MLTRLPGASRVSPEVAAEFLGQVIHEKPLSLDAAHQMRLVSERFPVLGVAGGAVYDALIAETIRVAGGTLVTLDRRALATYARLGCDAELLAS